jgi:hypothetical protein
MWLVPRTNMVKYEMNAKNNHGTCWLMQVACFAKFTGATTAYLTFALTRYKEVLCCLLKWLLMAVFRLS